MTWTAVAAGSAGRLSPFGPVGMAGSLFDLTGQR